MNLILKLLGTGASILSGIVAAKVLDFAWTKATGNEPPKDAEGSLENSLRSAVAFAVVSGAVSQVIRVLTNRGTQRAIQRYQKTPEIV
ncbi:MULTISPECIES: DUF4235 domain-containing protein [Arthrobacter]|uniref:DUF4235 domain-containing protein n=2 Tax=Arthrobacter TaxID=1663 RepID=A0ABT1NMP7_9MICC|nr:MULTISPECIES: DUF4235 domain-containing protein [Arthrobacter]MCC3290011.1 DUF4235 domain-containing protein [Arthrobacter sp. zg-Y1110]MCC3300477.1 DUF4235 domain-containing protein [Arthrobacter sp. zg-Y895]MCC9173590.1 DUF4235 domain-containing protein [Arthrobacter sp. zg-Y179]MCQ1945856.1 DUF4235 domain-containing protein [Arthrobacter sp. zg-Y1116]MCQ1949008.1 DUF4235 domain-containing protein [Arthrobacter jinronghuae]